MATTLAVVNSRYSRFEIYVLPGLSNHKPALNHVTEYIKDKRTDSLPSSTGSAGQYTSPGGFGPQQILSVNKHGHIIYYHVPDTTFDINDYILQLKSQLCTWRNVYWRVWGTVNYLMCMRCEQRFPCYHLGHCDYHPEKPRFNDSSRNDPSDPVGIYPCCHKKVPRFNPTSLDKGCRVRDHIVNLSSGLESMPSSSAVTLDQIYNDLLSHREIVCVPYEREEIPEEEEKVNIFANEDFQKQSSSSSTFKLAFFNHNTEDHEKKSDNCRFYNKLWFSQDSDFDHQISSPIESEDEVGDDEVIKVPRRRFQKAHIMVDPQNILLDTPEFQPTQKSLWNAQRSVRHNQDAQRQEDLRRMRDIVSYLTKLRLSTDKIEKSRKEHSGGVYTRIENQWKNNFLQMGKLLNQQVVRLSKHEIVCEITDTSVPVRSPKISNSEPDQRCELD